LNLVYTSRFKKDFKRVMKRNKDDNKLWRIVELLMKGGPLPPEYRDHWLGGDWADRRDCHVGS
jgi:mRNA interferase YafQ